MSRTGTDRDLELEEAAQGQDLFRAPGKGRLLEQAEDQAEASGWISEESISWPSVDTRQRIVNRRQDLYDEMRRLESSVARPSGLADWRIEIEASLASLEESLASHVHQVESENGLFAEILEKSPHLAANIEALTEEHEELMTACHQALSMAADWSPPTLRRKVNVLLVRLAVHRQFGAELLFDAYNVDIPAAD